MKLSASEEQVMKYLWKLDSAYMKDLVEAYPEPKPAYTTVATLITRMIKKGYVGYEQRGSVREYYPKVKKTDYFSGHIRSIVKDFFNNSAAQFGSFFAQKTDMSMEELEALRNLIDEEIKAKQQKQ